MEMAIIASQVGGLKDFEALLKALNDDSLKVRVAAERDLRAMGPRASDLLLAELSKLHQDRDGQVLGAVIVFVVMLCLAMILQWIRTLVTGNAGDFPLFMTSGVIGGSLSGYY